MISTILQYSTLDIRFLETNLKQLSKFSDEIIVPICDHLFNGEPENEELLKTTYEIISKYEKCSGYMFEWQGQNSNPGYYHNLSRALGTSIAEGDWLLFVDADEIVDDTFKEWFETVKNTNNSYWMTCYWYFREPTYQSRKTESAGFLVKKEYCNWELDVREERQQLFHKVPVFINGDVTPIVSNEGYPMIHHYSWVRSEADMIKKVNNWGHKNDTNWVDLVKEEFSRPFNGTDFVHGYQYNFVENKFKL